jgi:hypothetical protein
MAWAAVLMKLIVGFSALPLLLWLLCFVALQVAELMAGERAAGSVAGSREASPGSPLKHAAAAAAGGATGAAAAAGVASVLTDEQAAEQDMEEVGATALWHKPHTWPGCPRCACMLHLSALLATAHVTAHPA